MDTEMDTPAAKNRCSSWGSSHSPQLRYWCTRATPQETRQICSEQSNKQGSFVWEDKEVLFDPNMVNNRWSWADIEEEVSIVSEHQSEDGALPECQDFVEFIDSQKHCDQALNVGLELLGPDSFSESSTELAQTLISGISRTYASTLTGEIFSSFNGSPQGKSEGPSYCTPPAHEEINSPSLIAPPALTWLGSPLSVNVGIDTESGRGQNNWPKPVEFDDHFEGDVSRYYSCKKVLQPPNSWLIHRRH